MKIYTCSRKQAAMAEDLENLIENIRFSRNLEKATLRNTTQGDSLKKDLSFIKVKRNKLLHSWEQKKRTFVQRNSGKRPVIRWSGEDVEKRDKKEKVSKHIINSEGYRRSDKSVREGSKLSLQQFTETSRHDNKDICTVQGDKKVIISCMPKLTVKDLSRILCPSLSDAENTRCFGTTSPSTSNGGLDHHFSNLLITKEPTIRHDFFSLQCKFFALTKTSSALVTKRFL